MTARHAALPIAALLVLGAGVYLFVEVRAQPAAPAPPVRERSQPVRANIDEVPQPAAAEPSRAGAQPPTAPASPANPTSPTAAPSRGAAGAVLQPDPDVTSPQLEAVMAEANKAYDRADYEDAKLIANGVLTRDPTNVRMLRIMVSASCIDGDTAVAQTHYARLPAHDQEQMKIRCARYGIAFASAP